MTYMKITGEASSHTKLAFTLGTVCRHADKCEFKKGLNIHVVGERPSRSLASHISINYSVNWDATYLDGVRSTFRDFTFFSEYIKL